MADAEENAAAPEAESQEVPSPPTPEEEVQALIDALPATREGSFTAEVVALVAGEEEAGALRPLLEAETDVVVLDRAELLAAAQPAGKKKGGKKAAPAETEAADGAEDPVFALADAAVAARLEEGAKKLLEAREADRAAREAALKDLLARAAAPAGGDGGGGGDDKKKGKKKGADDKKKKKAAGGLKEKKAREEAEAAERARIEQLAADIAQAKADAAEYAASVAALPDSQPLHVVLVGVVGSAADAERVLLGQCVAVSRGPAVAVEEEQEACEAEEAEEARDEAKAETADADADAAADEAAEKTEEEPQQEETQQEESPLVAELAGLRAVAIHRVTVAGDDFGAAAAGMLGVVREHSAARPLYKAWREGVPVVVLPDADPAGPADRRTYDRLAGGSVSGVMAALVEQVVVSAGGEEGPGEAGVMDALMDELRRSGPTAAAAAAAASAAAGSLAVLLAHGDSEGDSEALAALTLHDGEPVPLAEWASRPAAARPASDAAAARPPAALAAGRAGAEPASESARGVLLTQLLHRSGVSEATLSRAAAVIGFEELLAEFGGGHDDDVPRDYRLGGRRHVEELDADTARQVLEAAADPPHVECRTRYVARDDTLLVAVHAHTPLVRRDERVWEGFVCPDLSFQQWVSSPESVRAAAPPRVYSMEDRHGGRLSHASERLFPADRACLGRTAASGDAPAAWLSCAGDLVKLSDGTLSARLASAGGWRVEAGGAGAGVSLLGPSGRSASFSTLAGGAALVVSQRAPGGERRDTAADGTVTVTLAGGAGTRVLGADGSVTLEDGTRVAADGSRAAADGSPLPPLESADQTDPGSGARSTTREDLVLVIRYADGSRLAQHADGTRVYTDAVPAEAPATATRVHVESPGFAPVTVETASNPVSIELAERAVRASAAVAVAPGVAFELRRDGTAVVDAPAPSGRLELAANGTGSYAPAAAGARAYALDVGASSVSTTDAEDNSFVASAIGGARATLFRHKGIAEEGADPAESDFIPARYYPAPEDPAPPRLFVLRADGSGHELLSDDAVALLEGGAAGAELPAEPAGGETGGTSRSWMSPVCVPRPYAREAVIPPALRASAVGRHPRAPPAGAAPGSVQFVRYRHVLELPELAADDLEKVRGALRAQQEENARQAAVDAELAEAQATGEPETGPEERLVRDAIAAARARREAARAKAAEAAREAAEAEAERAGSEAAAAEAVAAAAAAAADAERREASAFFRPADADGLAASQGRLQAEREEREPIAPAAAAALRKAASGGDGSNANDGAELGPYFANAAFQPRYRLETAFWELLAAESERTGRPSEALDALEEGTRAIHAARRSGPNIAVVEDGAAPAPLLEAIGFARAPDGGGAWALVRPAGDASEVLLDALEVLCDAADLARHRWRKADGAAAEEAPEGSAGDAADSASSTSSAPESPRDFPVVHVDGGAPDLRLDVDRARREERLSRRVAAGSPRHEARGASFRNVKAPYGTRAAQSPLAQAQRSYRSPRGGQQSPPGSGRAHVPTLAMGASRARSTPRAGATVANGARSPLRTASTHRSSGEPESGVASFAVQPAVASFGRVRCGQTYRLTLAVTNEGNFSGRFRVSARPPRQTDMFVRVLHRAGPVAPGMRVLLDVELFCSTPGECEALVTVESEAAVATVPVVAHAVEAAVPSSAKAATPEEADDSAADAAAATAAAQPPTSAAAAVLEGVPDATASIADFGKVGLKRRVLSGPTAAADAYFRYGAVPASDRRQLQQQQQQ